MLLLAYIDEFFVNSRIGHSDCRELANPRPDEWIILYRMYGCDQAPDWAQFNQIAPNGSRDLRWCVFNFVGMFWCRYCFVQIYLPFLAYFLRNCNGWLTWNRNRRHLASSRSIKRWSMRQSHDYHNFLGDGSRGKRTRQCSMEGHWDLWRCVDWCLLLCDDWYWHMVVIVNWVLAYFGIANLYVIFGLII